MVTFDDSFVMNHTCLRIKDPKVSIPFYEKNFGMKVISTLEYSLFTLFMLNFETAENKNKPWASREGVLELCHNHGAESDENYTVNNGNGSTFRGFGHICVSVDNIQECESTLLKNQAKFQKKLSDGRQKNIAFVLDPDGYWIELVEHEINKTEGVTDMSTYKFNHTMVRVKDPKKSLDFYTKKMGMKLLATSTHELAKFTLYFLAYDHKNTVEENKIEVPARHMKESLLELTHNWGTENDESFAYHNGNSTENGAKQGYGHISINCKDPAKFCSELESEIGEDAFAVRWGKAKMSDSLAFVRDPDGYSIEILPLQF